MKANTTISRRTFRRHQREWERERRELLFKLEQAKTDIAVADSRVRALSYLHGLADRLERIRLIVEEIIEHHDLADPIRNELMAAVHQSMSRRPLKMLFHVRGGEALVTH